MKPTDLPLLSSVSRPTVHPDGSHVVTAVSRPDLTADRTVGQLWRVNLDGSGSRRITRGVNDTNPQYSPDGRILAFLRAPLDGAPQLHIMDADGGEPRPVTDQKLGIGAWCWSPDSRRIAFTAPVAEEGRYGTIANLSPSAEPARRITTLKYRSNGIGYTVDRRRHVFLIEVPAPNDEPDYPVAPSVHDPKPEPTTSIPDPRRLTSGDHDHGAIAFAPDGATLAVVAARHPGRDLDLSNDVFELDLGGPEDSVPAVAAATGLGERHGISSVQYGPGGELWFVATDLGTDGTDFVGRGSQLWVRDVPGRRERLLTDARTVDLDGDLTVTAEGALVHGLDRGRVNLLRVTIDGAFSPLVAEDLEIRGSASVRPMGGVGAVTVVSYTAPSSMGELGLVTPDGLRPLSDFSAGLRATGVTALEELSVSGRDGTEIHGWVLTPVGDEPHPVLLVIHGGPFTQWGVSFFDEAQVYVEAGYAVVMCNPRGSAGYGHAHARAIRHRMGTADFGDVIDFLEGALARHPTFDATRIGIMGGSYGGYLTAWTIANDHRFAGAIVERGYLDPEGFVGTSDIGSFFSDEYTGTDPQRMREQSPQAMVGRVSTPTLVIHSEEDLRCPLGQGERYYAALKRNGVEAELIIFPGENHELSRSGRPRHRLQRFDAVLEWWSRHLPTAANPASSDRLT